MTIRVESTSRSPTAGRLLLGPGPSMVHPRVYHAMSRPLFGHLDPEFLAIMDRMQARLREVFLGHPVPSEAAQQAAANVYAG